MCFIAGMDKNTKYTNGVRVAHSKSKSIHNLPGEQVSSSGHYKSISSVMDYKATIPTEADEEIRMVSYIGTVIDSPQF